MSPPVERGLGLGRIFGIEVRLDVSVLVIFGLIVYSLGSTVFPGWHPDWSAALTWTTALATGVLFFASLLAHELSHSVVAQAHGIRVPRITLFLFGGMAEMEREPASPKVEFLTAIAGPAMSLVLGVIFANLATWLGGPGFLERIGEGQESALAGLSPLATACVWLGAVNLVLAVFNLIPGFPLDGGRVFRAIMWGITGDQVLATRWASNLGRYFGWTLMAFGAWTLVQGGLQGLWLILIGWFLTHLARASYSQLLTQRALGGLQVEDLMRTRFDQVDRNTAVSDFIDDYLLRSAQLLWPVVQDDRPIGTISLTDVVNIDEPERRLRKVDEVMRPLVAEQMIAPDQTGRRILELLAAAGEEPLPVIRDGRVVGLIHRSDILKWLALHRLG